MLSGLQQLNFMSRVVKGGGGGSGGDGGGLEALAPNGDPVLLSSC